MAGYSTSLKLSIERLDDLARLLISKGYEDEVIELSSLVVVENKLFFDVLKSTEDLVWDFDLS
jgi:hypothetical protein